MRFHEVLAQRITGMTQDARRLGRASRIDTGVRAASSGLSAAHGELTASLSACPGADTTKASQASLAKYMFVLRSTVSQPRISFCCSCRALYLSGSASVDALPLIFRWAMFPLTLPFVAASTWRLPSSFVHASPNLFHPPPPPFPLNTLLTNPC